MSTLPVERDELCPIMRAVPLTGARVLDLGCGAGRLTRRLVAEAGAAAVIGMDGDREQITRNAAAAEEGVRFVHGEAQNLPLPDAALDVVVMMKSLHHVPIDAMDKALEEVARVTRPGGWVWICEPAYSGDFNDILRIFHDEGPERAAALEALERAQARGILHLEGRHDYIRPLHFRSFGQFRENLMHLPWLKSRITPEIERRVAGQFAAAAHPDGSADFTSPMLAFCLRKPEPELSDA